jgi:hypothetical protein
MSKSFNSIGECRLAVVNHFDSVTSDVDHFIEKELQSNFQDEAKTAEINQKREVLLKEIKAIEHLNLKHVNEHLATSSKFLIDEISKLFTSFCFVLEFDKDIRLIVTDGFLSNSQVALYHKLVNLLREKYPLRAEAERIESYGHFFEIDLFEVNI